MPATIISRTQRFDFRRIPADAIVGKLTRIVAAEGAEAEPEALALIARLADGGMRDAESLLDQVLAYAGDRITLQAVREAVGLADDAAITALLNAYVAGDAPAALDQIEALADGGRDMAQVAAQAEGEARQLLLLAAADPPAARRLATILRTLAKAAGEEAQRGPRPPGDGAAGGGAGLARGAARQGGCSGAHPAGRAGRADHSAARARRRRSPRATSWPKPQTPRPQSPRPRSPRPQP